MITEHLIIVPICMMIAFIIGRTMRRSSGLVIPMIAIVPALIGLIYGLAIAYFYSRSTDIRMLLGAAIIPTAAGFFFGLPAGMFGMAQRTKEKQKFRH